MPIPGCQRFTKPDLSYDHPDDGQTEHGDPDSEDAANEGVCFHGPTLSRAAPGVLIERNYSAIDRSDEGEKEWPESRMAMATADTLRQVRRFCALPL